MAINTLCPAADILVIHHPMETPIQEESLVRLCRFVYDNFDVTIDCRTEADKTTIRTCEDDIRANKITLVLGYIAGFFVQRHFLDVICGQLNKREEEKWDNVYSQPVEVFWRSAVN